VREREDGLFYAGAGPLAAILLGVALTPLRGLTTASNLAFVFIALTVVVAELGGRGAALATALVSSLSLDFFLTQPYLRLAIEDKQDVIAFVGLAVCGLIAAALASQRRGRLAALAQIARQRELLHAALRLSESTSPGGSDLAALLARVPQAVPVAAAVLRDERGQVLAAAHPADAARATPGIVLELAGLRPVGETAEQSSWDLALPREGGRLGLTLGGRSFGWLDVWGDGRAAGVEARRALSDLARLLALQAAAWSRGREAARA
jgi:K+-sensing histidine kinase KdpD